MNKVKINPGTTIKLADVLDNLQTYIKANFDNRILRFFKSFGTINDTNGTVTNTNNLLLQNKYSVAKPNQCSITPGSVLLSNGEQITLTTEYSFNLSDIVGTLTANTFYLIKLSYAELGIDAVPVMNSFVYDSSGNNQYTLRYSNFKDSFIITASVITTGIDYNTLVLDNEVALGIVQTSSTSNVLNTGTFTFNSLSTTIGALDLRATSSAKISKAMLDGNDVLLKDRDSINDQKINGAVESNSYFKAPQLNIEGLTQLFKIISQASGDNSLTISPDTTNAPIKILDKNGAIVAYFDTATGKVGIMKQPTAATLDIDGTIKTSGLITATDLNITAGSDAYGHLTFTLSDTIFDLYTQDNSTGNGSLNIQPITYNRPINIYDKDGNLIFNVDTANKKIGIGKVAGTDTVEILGTMNVLGTIKAQDNSGHSRYVMLQPLDTLATGIKNFKISDVNGTNTANKLGITVQWGYSDIVGTGGNNNFTVTSSALNVIINELAGYYFYIPSIQTNFKIIGNTATTSGTTILNITNIDDTSHNLTGVNTTSSNYGIVHSNADEYTVRAICLDDLGNPVPQQSINVTVTTDGTIAPSITTIDLISGAVYKIAVMAKKAGNILAWQEMTAGSYTK